ncbi:conserved repeat domain-containing protein [Deinococcus reticulitermitis]|uniref:Conserved repeat domain-containing protein n=1 Tax=Deinococcus reticulitermitis TaxID=856736 RepID=A0A1H7C4C6_9DEIO|nr:DUF11 domain-containing protein [Deinococcus reticulitermitis]SEJ81872.1 conserved repeat domain-containing protein [Deinococcus reticulitermitis]
MNRNVALMALTGILTLASCGQNGAPVCENGQTLVNGVCTVTTTPITERTLTFTVAGVTGSVPVTIVDANGNVVRTVNVANGDKVTLPSGNYTVRAGMVTGYTTPANATVNLTNSNGTVTLTYVANPNQVSNVLTIDLAGVASAPITIKDASGAIVAGYNGALTTDLTTVELPAGTYTVLGGVVPGYATPAPVTVNLTGGNATATVSYVANPTQQTSVLTIDLNGVSSAPVTITDQNGAVVAGYTNAQVTDGQTVTLPRGRYTVTLGATPGFTPNVSSVSVDLREGNGTATFNFTAIVSQTGRSTAYYVNADGNRVYFSDINGGRIDPTRFRFNAWLDDKDGGVNSALVGQASATGIGVVRNDAAVNEQQEFAPLDNQNIVGAYMEYNDNGTWRPVVNAEVQMNVLPEYQVSRPLIRFSAADDQNRTTAPITAQDITTNGFDSRSWTNAGPTDPNPIGYPQSAKFNYYNATGVDNPLVPGYTWAALFHDPIAEGYFDGEERDSLYARVRVIGYVDGQEIEKHFLDKNFVPSADVSVIKELVRFDRTTNQVLEVLNDNGSVEYLPGTEVGLRITVRNTGDAEARNIQLQERFAEGTRLGYSIGITPQERARLAASGNNVRIAGLDLNADNELTDEEFDATLDLEAGESESILFFATGTANGRYCDTATITSYVNNPDPVTGVGRLDAIGVPLSDNACFTVFGQPDVNIIKEVVSARDNNPIRDGTTVNGNEDVTIRIRIRNNGTQEATNIRVTDLLENAALQPFYSVTPGAPVVGITDVARTQGDDGLTFTVPNLQPNQEVSYLYTARGAFRGLDADNNGIPDADSYCDVASFVADGGQEGSSRACFTVAQARLTISKTNTPTSLTGGELYTSTIIVRNTGSSDALNVRVQDILGIGPAGARVEYVNGRYIIRTDEDLPYTGERGVEQFDSDGNGTLDAVRTLGEGTATGVNIPAGGFLTLNVVSRVPFGAAPGDYCNVASVSADTINLVSTIREARACVTVRPVSAVQTEFNDTFDNLRAGDSTLFTATAYNEDTSTESLRSNVFLFNVGYPEGAAGEGLFDVSGITLYYDTEVEVDARGGVIFRAPGTDTTGTTTVLPASAYTVQYPDGNTRGSFNVVLNPGFEIEDDQAVFVTFNGSTRADMPIAEYFSSFSWNSTGTLSGDRKGPATVIESTKISYPAATP